VPPAGAVAAGEAEEGAADADGEGRPAARRPRWRPGLPAGLACVAVGEGSGPALVTDLSQRAHAVRTAATALDGIREVSHHPPEVIVLDLGLPDLDGQQALQMMRAVTETPVIVATARDEEAEIIRLLNAGADDYLVKPFSG
jgi:CheY-like chemotaxis protein